ncbi:NnrU family protein [Hahella ganghwensis]|uniref:NnrU family protein n=1 Tax=Hahella ganghwensis TaxID=286420 RepID=UPI00037CCF8C|nr:NnrU family protein [Hahella ganghwensis]
MMWLVIGLILFLGGHSISIFAGPWRDAMASRLGEITWKGIYSVVALVGFILIVVGYGEARVDPMVLFTPPAWLRHVTMLLMIPVFPLLLATYLPGRIKTAVKHPMLIAVKTWALAHLLANGMLADLLLFGGFLIWAVADRISMKHRTQRSIPGAPPGKANDIIAVVGGLGIFVAFALWGHQWLIGMPLISR